MKNYVGYTIIILLIVIICIWFIEGDFSNKDSPLIKKIEELESKIDSLNNKKDSIILHIDSTHIKIVDNEKSFKEKVNTIIIQPDTFSESFTRQYLREYATTRGYRIIRTSETEY